MKKLEISNAVGKLEKSDAIGQLEKSDGVRQLERTRISEITQLHGEIAGYIKVTLEKAIRIGELLAEQKAELGHGEWLPWVEENLPFTDRTARNYMRAYESRDRLKTEIVSDLTGAYRLLEESRADRVYNCIKSFAGKIGQFAELLDTALAKGDLDRMVDLLRIDPIEEIAVNLRALKEPLDTLLESIDDPLVCFSLENIIDGLINAATHYSCTQARIGGQALKWKEMLESKKKDLVTA